MREEKEESKEDILKHLNVWFVLGGSQPRLHFVSRLKRGLVATSFMRVRTRRNLLYLIPPRKHGRISQDMKQFHFRIFCYLKLQYVTFFKYFF